MIEIMDSWFTVEEIDSETFAISEYGHWEKVHSYLLLGEANVKKIYGAHNQLGLYINALDDVSKAVKELREKNLIKHGTGIHKFNGFSIWF